MKSEKAVLRCHCVRLLLRDCSIYCTDCPWLRLSPAVVDKAAGWPIRGQWQWLLAGDAPPISREVWFVGCGGHWVNPVWLMQSVLLLLMKLGEVDKPLYQRILRSFIDTVSAGSEIMGKYPLYQTLIMLIQLITSQLSGGVIPRPPSMTHFQNGRWPIS